MQLPATPRLVKSPHIMIEVIPAGTGAHEGVTGAFALADFADVPSVGYQEGAVRGQPVEEPEDVASLDRVAGVHLPHQGRDAAPELNPSG
jgi:hypothetical protein